MNLFTLLEMAADAMGDRIAISHGGHANPEGRFAELFTKACF